MPSGLRATALLLACSLVVGCGAGTSAGPAKIPPVTGPPPGGSPSANTKPVLRGLVAQGVEPTPARPATNDLAEPYAHPGVYTAAVVDLGWSQLEPAQGTFDDGAITSALSNIATYNAKYPSTPMVAKLRVFAGESTPAWVIQATGGVTLSDSNGNSATVGEFWTPAYRSAWQALQTHLASVYDANPAVGEVAISSCSTLTAEPFIIPLGPAAIATLHQAGYTDAQYQACLSGAPADYAAWKLTPLDYTFNSFVALDSNSAVSTPAFSIQVMDNFRAALGTRGVIANHGLQPTLKPAAQPIFAEFTNLYDQANAVGQLSPLEFQTYGPTVDWPTSITYGLTFHPTEIEIWNTTAAGGGAPLSQSQLQGWAAALQ